MRKIAGAALIGLLVGVGSFIVGKFIVCLIDKATASEITVRKGAVSTEQVNPVGGGSIRFQVGCADCAHEHPTVEDVTPKSWPINGQSIAQVLRTPEYAQQSLSIRVGPNSVVSIDNNGKVTFSEGYTPDDAARAFWTSISRTFPQMCIAPASAQYEMPQH